MMQHLFLLDSGSLEKLLFKLLFRKRVIFLMLFKPAAIVSETTPKHKFIEWKGN